MEGGETSTIRRVHRIGDGGDKSTALHDRVVTDDRKKAVVIVTDYMRKVRKNRLAKTPFGSIFDDNGGVARAYLLALMEQANSSAIFFNKTSSSCKIWNCMVWEPLAGNRLKSLAYWYHHHEHSKRAKAVLRAILQLSDVDG